MTIAQQMAADFQAILSDIPRVFTFGGTDYSCTATDLLETKPIADAGYELDYDLELKVATADFGAVTPPDKNDELTYLGVVYRVETRSLGHGGTVYTYKLNRAK